MPLPDAVVDLLAERLRVIGEPTRIRLLERLRGGELAVCELVGTMGSTQQNISKHLQVLRQAGIVRRRKDGNRVVYGIADHSVLELCETVCGGLAAQVAELDQILQGAAR